MTEREMRSILIDITMRAKTICLLLGALPVLLDLADIVVFCEIASKLVARFLRLVFLLVISRRLARVLRKRNIDDRVVLDGADAFEHSLELCIACEVQAGFSEIAGNVEHDVEVFELLHLRVECRIEFRE